MIKNLNLQRCARWAGIFLLISMISATGFVINAIYELNLKIIARDITPSTIKQSKSILERDTKVELEDLETYLLFSKDINVKDFIEREVELGNIRVERNNVYVNNDVELPAILPNNCERYRCLQFRRPFEKIPSNIWKVLLGTEDFRFLEHRGVDPFAIARALVVDIIALKFVQGGSTLTQQLVKNLFLSNEKKISRKIKEMVYALYIENIMSKEKIVELYLNEVFWGSFNGIYLKGHYAASLAYFNKSPEELSEYEATSLISLLKGPNYYRPSLENTRLRNRVNAVFKRLKSIGVFTKQEGSYWDDNEWNRYISDYVKRLGEQNFNGYYELSKNTEIELSAFEKLVLFNAIDKVKEARKKQTKEADIAVKVFIANKECISFDCAHAFSYYSKIQREKRAGITGEFHQVGSLLKPVVYDTFIDLGKEFNDLVSTAPLTLNLKSGPWSPKDYSKAKQDKITLKQALQKSKNIPLIRVAKEIGFEKLEEQLGPRIPHLRRPLAEYPSQLLGAIELSLEEVFLVYKEFIDRKCEEIRTGAREFENSSLYFMSMADKTTISRLAAGALRNANVFGKTGTSNNGLDNWYFAFDGNNYYVIWFGVDSKRDGVNMRVSGASTAFLIFQDFMNKRGKQISEIMCE